MSFKVEPLGDADIEESFLVQHIAFRDGNTIGQFICPTPLPSNEYLTRATERRRSQILENPNIHFRKVTDTSTNNIIACATWSIFAHPRTPEEVEKLCHVPQPPADVVAEAWNDFFGPMSRGRKELGTSPAAILHSLYTYPEHYRRGAGKMLMESFVEEVDAAGVLAYLEATEMGRLLYERFGFEAKEVTEFDLRRYGGEGSDVNTIMVRKAKGMRKIDV